MGNQDQRPRFYEGQYLAADDLAAIIEYLRGADARHALGAHTWGIVLGLYLSERSAPGAPNRKEVILQPGFAWDGFGRALVVQQPTRLPESLFQGIAYNPAIDDPAIAGGPTGRLVKVWLNYKEFGARPPTPGFETCASDDQNARVRETFDFVIGEFPPGPQQRDSVTVGSQTFDAQRALKTFDAGADTLWDTSVPHQTFPTGRPPRWLVPLGYVRWVARDGDVGYFVDRGIVAADNVTDRIRAFRRYVGIVTEYIEAADGAIVLHKRGEQPDIQHRFAQLLNKAGQNAADLLNDLVWVEGNLRVEGDAKLAGGKLQFRDGDGMDQKTPMYLARTGDDPADGKDGKRELRAVIGPTSQTDNRWIVGPQDTSTPPNITPNLAVVSAGRVGVNTAQPVAALEVKGDWDGKEDGAVRVSGKNPTIRLGAGAEAGNENWAIQIGTEGPGNLKFSRYQPVGQWKTALHLTPSVSADVGGGQPGVGIRSDKPRNPLAIRATGSWEELISFEDASGATKWHINQKANATTSGINFCETGVADGRLFLKAGGDVGMGTLSPTNKLHVVGNTGIRQNRLYISGGDNWSSITYNAHHNSSNTAWVFPDPTRKSVTIEMDDSGGASRFEVYTNATGSSGAWKSHFKITGDNDNTIMAYNGGSVGVGTTNPQQKLHVAGNFLRVDGAGNEQAYLGGDSVASDVQLGSMNAAIMRVSLWNTAAASSMDLSCRDITCDDLQTRLLFFPSDAALKEDVLPIEKALDTVRKLRGVSFRWKADTRRKNRDFGLIAQEVEQVLPQLVQRSDRGAAVSYISLIPMLIESVKELGEQVEKLTAQVDALKRDKGGK